jgi:hypothetical protein
MCNAARPDQNAPLLIHGELLGVDEFVLEILQVRVIQRKLPLQGAIRYPLLALEPGDDVRQGFLKGHAWPSVTSFSAGPRIRSSAQSSTRWASAVA